MHSTVPPVSPSVKEKVAETELDGVFAGVLRVTTGWLGAAAVCASREFGSSLTSLFEAMARPLTAENTKKALAERIRTARSESLPVRGRFGADLVSDFWITGLFISLLRL